MAGQVYALFVGIDKYLPPVRSLGGCVNDITAMAELLRTLVGDALHPHTVTDEQATRENVMATFRSHLGQAGPDDIALFCYSGHGAQEAAPEEFWPVEPDHYNETIVCTDSRTPGKHDLADKELAGLINEVSTRGAEVVLILDCCHSGSGARDADLDVAADQQVRQVELDTRPRSLDSYDIAGQPVGAVAASATSVRSARGFSVAESGGRYVLLAACDPSQTAKEQRIGDQRRGVFSVSLQDALRSTAGRLSYADLISWATTRVNDLATAQTPQLEAAVAEDGRKQFLAGLIDTRPFYRLVHAASGWVVDAGQVHGIPAAVLGEQTTFAVYPIGEVQPDRTPIATATVSSVRTGSSSVTIAGAQLDETAIYAAVVRSRPIAPLPVSLTGTQDGIALLEARLSGDAAPAEIKLTETDVAELQVVATATGFQVRRSADGRLITEPETPVSAQSAGRIIDQLATVARWRQLRDLRSSSSGLSSTDLQLLVQDVAPGENSTTGSELRVSYGPNGANPAVRVAVTNTSDKRLYVAVLGLSDRYGVANLLGATWGEWLNPGDQLAARGGQPIQLQVADALWRNGVTEVSDTIKLIASTEAFSAEVLRQGELDAPTTRQERELTKPPTTLDQMFRGPGTRGFVDVAQAPTVALWTTASCTVTSIRPAADQIVDATGTEIAPGTTVTAPAGVTVTGRLVGEQQLARDTVLGALPPLLRTGSSPVVFTATRDVTDEPEALEIGWPAARPDITPDNPILVRIADGVQDGETIVPFGWDGEFWLPIGRTVARGQGDIQVAIERIDGSAEDAGGAADRGLGGSIRILFRKLVGRRFGLKYSWPRLAVATVKANGDVDYDVDAVPAAVANADRVVLYVHGIIGDTEGMVRYGVRAGLADEYDLTLAFDYENINTPIAETARDLAKVLREAGFKPDGNRRLDIVAHSMGGLVSRSYIEQAGGNQIVGRLVTAGTPHRGSPWPKIQDWATTALSVGLNGLGLSAFWPASVLGSLARVMERYDNALDDMNPGSEFLVRLGQLDDPDVPYFLIAGDRTALDEERTRTLLGRLQLRAWTAVDAFAFLSDPNDIAVTVESASTVPAGRALPPILTRVGCDHMTYFQSPDADLALRAALSAEVS